MKRICLILVVVAISQADSLQAQRLGDGRFLRRMFGVEEPVPAAAYPSPSSEKQAEEALKKQAAAKQQSLIEQREMLRRKAALEQRYQQQRLSTPQASQQRLGGNGWALPSPQSSPTPRPGAMPAAKTRYGYHPFGESSPPSSQPTPARNAKRSWRQLEKPVAPHAETKRSGQDPAPKRSGQIEGFGVNLRMKGKQATITRVQKSSTAAEAGLKQGDIVKSIGSLPIDSIEDAEQFAEVLKPGDQLEFELLRRGKETKMLVSYLRVAEENKAPSTSLDKSKVDRDFSAPGDFTSKGKADDEVSFLEDPNVNVSSRTQSILSKSELNISDNQNEVEKLREVVAMQKQIINGLTQRLNALENKAAAGPELNFPK